MSDSHTDKKNILMVYPAIPKGTYWGYGTALKLIDKKAVFPPLGLASVASMLPEDEVNIRLIDMNVSPFTDEDMNWADILFISAMIVQKESLEEVIGRAKTAGLPVVAGGPHPSSNYQEFADVNHFVIGEAEDILHTFWRDFKSGTAKSAYARPVSADKVTELKAYFGEDADIHQADSLPDINSAPLPRFDLMDLDAYKSMSVQASRGCPIGCEFCDIWRRFGRTPWTKTPEKIIAEFQSLYDLGWRGSLFIVDDNFIGNKKRAKEMLSAMVIWQKQNGYPYELFTEATLTLADDEELLSLFHDAGFDFVFLGIETPSEESLKETGKHINTKGSVAEKVARIQSYGLQVTSGFIIGFDNDPDDIAPRMIEFIQELGIPSAMVGLLQALPETDLHDRLKKEGRLRAIASGNNTHDFQVNFRTRRPELDIIEDYKQILQAIYPADMKAYFERCRILRRRWQGLDRPGQELKTTIYQLRIVARYLRALMQSSYRWQGLGFLLGTLFKKPSFFPMAVALGVQGHHYRAITSSAFEVAKLEGYLSAQMTRFRSVAESVYDAAVNNNTEVNGERLLVQLRESLVNVVGDRDEILNDARARLQRFGADARSSANGHMERIQDQYDKTYAAAAVILAERELILADARVEVERLRRDARHAALARYQRFQDELEQLCASLLPETAMIMA